MRGRTDLTIEQDHAIRRLALVISGVSLVNVLFVILMYSVSMFFGPLNDTVNGSVGVLLAALAWMLHTRSRERSGREGAGALFTVTIGAALVAAGSILVLFRITGWFYAGLITSTGFAVMGHWMISANLDAGRNGAWSPALTRLGVASGAFMLLGFTALPGIVRHVDDSRTAPWYLSLAFANGIGWFILLPIWSYRLARRAKV